MRQKLNEKIRIKTINKSNLFMARQYLHRLSKVYHTLLYISTENLRGDLHHFCCLGCAFRFFFLFQFFESIRYKNIVQCVQVYAICITHNITNIIIRIYFFPSFTFAIFIGSYYVFCSMQDSKLQTSDTTVNMIKCQTHILFAQNQYIENRTQIAA